MGHRLVTERRKIEIESRRWPSPRAWRRQRQDLHPRIVGAAMRNGVGHALEGGLQFPRIAAACQHAGYAAHAR